MRGIVDQPSPTGAGWYPGGRPLRQTRHADQASLPAKHLTWVTIKPSTDTKI